MRCLKRQPLMMKVRKLGRMRMNMWSMMNKMWKLVMMKRSANQSPLVTQSNDVVFSEVFLFSIMMVFSTPARVLLFYFGNFPTCMIMILVSP